MSSQRVSVAVAQEDYEVLQRLSKLNGQSMSAIVGELVHSVAPSLSRVADILQAASTAQGDFVQHLQKVVEEGEAFLSPLVSAGVDGLDEVTSQVLDAVRPPAL